MLLSIFFTYQFYHRSLSGWGGNVCEMFFGRDTAVVLDYKVSTPPIKVINESGLKTSKFIVWKFGKIEVLNKTYRK